MESIPVILFTFKFVVLAIGMFYAVKWHYDRGQKDSKTDIRVVLRTSVLVLIGFLIALYGLIQLTYKVSALLGLDTTFP